MAQAVGYLAWPTGPSESAESKARHARKVMDTYAYAVVVAAWDGWADDRPVTYFTLEGRESAITSTFDRLASGLHFGRVVLWMA